MLYWLVVRKVYIPTYLVKFVIHVCSAIGLSADFFLFFGGGEGLGVDWVSSNGAD